MRLCGLGCAEKLREALLENNFIRTSIKFNFYTIE